MIFQDVTPCDFTELPVFPRILLPPSSGYKKWRQRGPLSTVYKVLCLKIPHIVFRIDIFSTGVQIKISLVRVILLPALQSSVGS
jgi:hypothetical protein